MDEWMKKMLGEEEWNLGICDNVMDPEGIMLSETSQTEKVKYLMISVISGILKKEKKMNS